MHDIMVAAVKAYVAGFNAKDAESIAALFADDASVIDPVGTNPKTGKAAIAEFYKMSVSNGATLALDGPIRTAANSAAFSFRVTVGGTGFENKAVDVDIPAGPMTIDVIDMFEFNDAGKITTMRAYWGPSNISS